MFTSFISLWKPCPSIKNLAIWFPEKQPSFEHNSIFSKEIQVYLLNYFKCDTFILLNYYKIITNEKMNARGRYF
jgi:hypothetical protein